MADEVSGKGIDAGQKLVCKYGDKCYRRNPDHLRQFEHPEKVQPSQENKNNHGSKRKSKETHDDAETKRTRKDNGTSSNNTEIQEPLTDQPGQKDDRISSSDEENEPERAASEEVEEDAPASPADVRDNIKQKFLVDMPEDFYSFWELCKSIQSARPQDAFSQLNLKLVGPYDVLSGELKTKNLQKASAFLTHCRYYYDPPEFQTILAGDDPETQFHIGYFRDSPDELPAFVAQNSASIDCTIKAMGENIFAAIDSLLCKDLEREGNKKSQADLKKLQNALRAWAKKDGYSLEQKTAKMKARDKKVVSKCFHGAGLVVPYDKKTEVGYRPLPNTDADLKGLLKKIVACKTEEQRDKLFDSLQATITLVQFATDECDYGMGLELGMDLFCFGHTQFHRIVRNLMPLAYELLQRPQFAQIVEAHLASRRINLLTTDTK